MFNHQDLSSAAQAVYNAMRAAATSPTNQVIKDQHWKSFYTADFYQNLYHEHVIQPIAGFNPQDDKQVACYLGVLTKRGLYVGVAGTPMARVRVS